MNNLIKNQFGSTATDALCFFAFICLSIYLIAGAGYFFGESKYKELVKKCIDNNVMHYVVDPKTGKTALDFIKN